MGEGGALRGPAAGDPRSSPAAPWRRCDTSAVPRARRRRRQGASTQPIDYGSRDCRGGRGRQTAVPVRNYGLPLPHNWTTIINGAEFGTDYYTRTAVAKSNILVNKPNETRYFYQDLDAAGQRLRGDRNYRVTFAKDQLPPVRGFWSMTLYNEHHFFHPNDLKRYSLGTKNNKTLQRGADGSLTLYVGATPPPGDLQSNWLPAPSGEFSLYVCSYWPEVAISEGRWTPPAVVAG
jgi:hypothetical protein